MKHRVLMVVAAFATVTLLGACADAGDISAPPPRQRSR